MTVSELRERINILRNAQKKRFLVSWVKRFINSIGYNRINMFLYGISNDIVPNSIWKVVPLNRVAIKVFWIISYRHLLKKDHYLKYSRYRKYCTQRNKWVLLSRKLKNHEFSKRCPTTSISFNIRKLILPIGEIHNSLILPSRLTNMIRFDAF